MYLAVLRWEDVLPRESILARLQNLKPQLVGDRSNLPGRLRVLSRLVAPPEEYPYQGNPNVVLKLKRFDELGPEVSITAIEDALERTLAVQKLSDAGVTHFEERGDEHFLVFALIQRMLSDSALCSMAQALTALQSAAMKAPYQPEGSNHHE